MMPDRTPEVSIITAVRNGERYISGAVRSIAMQTFTDLEHILIDGASTDRTVELATHSFPFSQVVISEPDKGLSDALNKGISLARGKYIFYLNADDELNDPHVLADLVRATRATDVVYGNKVIIDPAGRTCGERRVTRLYRPVSRLGLKFGGSFFIYLDCALIRREAVNRVSGFDIALKHCMDTDLFIKLYKAGARFRHLRRPIIKFRIHPESISVANPGQGIDETSRIVRRHFGAPDKTLSAAVLRTVAKTAWACAFLAQGDVPYLWRRVVRERLNRYTDYQMERL